MLTATLQEFNIIIQLRLLYVNYIQKSQQHVDNSKDSFCHIAVGLFQNDMEIL